MSINKHNSRVINNPDLLTAWEAGIKETQKKQEYSSSKNILSSSNASIVDLKYYGFPLKDLDSRLGIAGMTLRQAQGGLENRINHSLFSTFS
ncbi:MAG: hypothetical protein ACRENO_03135, partial [Thermodesulfobacteriota bacterium]